MGTIKSLLIFIALLLCAQPCLSEELKPLRRWVVFPFSSNDEKLKPTANQAWWKFREKITEKKRFLVASKQLLQQKDVYEPRSQLKPEDVKYLAQLLDADVLVTGFNEYRDFTVNVYLSQNGQLLWSKKLGFHPSLKATDQLLQVSTRLVAELLDQIPYHGFVVATEEKLPINTVAIDIGNNDSLKPGDEVKFYTLDIQGDPQKFSLENIENNQITEGKVSKVKKDYALVDVKRNVEGLKEEVFVSIAKEKRQSGYQEQLAPEMLPSNSEETANPQGHSKQFVVFGSIFGFLAILLLAF